MKVEITTEDQSVTEVPAVSSFKEIAMPLVAREIPVIPIPPHQKAAALKSWQNLATTDSEQIEKWDEENREYNVGAVAKPDGFWMLDCDVPDLRQTIEKETDQLFPSTFSVKSRKGIHYYFRQTSASREMGNVSVEGLFDAQVRNKYVVGPGSIHPSGKRYEIENDADIVEAPDWLIEWIKKQRRRSDKVKKQLHIGAGKVKTGNRDNFLFNEALKLRDFGQSKEDALVNLLAINQERCDPPMDDYIVQQKIDSAFTREPRILAAVVEEPLQKVGAIPVDGGALLRSLEDHFTRYAVLEMGLPLVLSLWSIATYLFSGFDTFPYLAVTSPTKRCGKSRVGELLEFVSAKPENTVEISPAALFRLVHEKKPTLILEEAENLSGKSDGAEALRAILNAGYRKGKKVRRSAKKNEDGNYQVEEYETFCPKAIILIGNLPDTLSDRCIPIRMKRRTNENLARFRFFTAQKEATQVKDKMAVWAATNVDKVVDYYYKNDLLFISDREAELWLPLFSVLAVADPCRLAELEITAMQLSDAKSASEPTELSIKLLADLRQIFAGSLDGAQQATSEALLNSLKALEESPWKDYGFGKGLSARKLAELLRPYEIRPQNVRTVTNGKVNKAYKKDSFEDAWERYLPPTTQTASESRQTATSPADVDPDAWIAAARAAGDD